MSLTNDQLPGLDQLRAELTIAFERNRQDIARPGVSMLPEIIEHGELGPEAQRIAGLYGTSFAQVDEFHYIAGQGV